MGASQAELRLFDATGALSKLWLGTASDWTAVYDIQAGAIGELYMSGTTPSATFTWVEGTGVVADLSETVQDATVAPEDVTGSWTAVTGTELSPAGTEDLGGGYDDMLAMKYIVP